MWEISIFCCWARLSPHLQGFPQMVGLGEDVVHSIYGWANKQDESRENIFGKMDNTLGIIQGDNSAGQFCTKRFNSNELFKISHGYETGNKHHSQNVR